MTYDRFGEQYRWQFFQIAELRRRPHPAGDATGTASPSSRSTSSSAPRTRARTTPRSFPFTATSSTACSGTRSSLSCSPSTARRERRTWSRTITCGPFFHLRHGDGLARLAVLAAGRGTNTKTSPPRPTASMTSRPSAGTTASLRSGRCSSTTRAGIGTTNEQRQQDLDPRLQRAALAAARLDHRPLAVLQLRG